LKKKKTGEIEAAAPGGTLGKASKKKASNIPLAVSNPRLVKQLIIAIAWEVVPDVHTEDSHGAVETPAASVYREVVRTESVTMTAFRMVEPEKEAVSSFHFTWVDEEPEEAMGEDLWDNQLNVGPCWVKTCANLCKGVDKYVEEVGEASKRSQTPKDLNEYLLGRINQATNMLGRLEYELLEEPVSTRDALIWASAYATC
jgi:hypothetical protein